MKAVVNQDNCIGCGLCAGACAEVFELVNDKAMGKEIPAGKEDEAKETASNCPVGAIEIQD